MYLQRGGHLDFTRKTSPFSGKWKTEVHGLCTRINWLLFSHLAVWVLYYWTKLYNLQLINVDSKGMGSSGSASSPAFEDLLLLDYGI